jgi:hypothetical protein
MPTKKRRAAQGVRAPRKPETPHFIEPMAALSVAVLPEGPEWSYELKLDGSPYLGVVTFDPDARASMHLRNLVCPQAMAKPYFQ